MTELQELKEKVEKALEKLTDYQTFKEEYRQKYGEVKTELDNILAKIEKLEKSGRWEPEVSEKYYCILCSGDIEDDTWRGRELDYEKLSIGNVFPTIEAAKFAVERLKVLAEMQEFTFEPDWEDKEQKKYLLGYTSWGIEAYATTMVNYGLLYFASKKQAEICIDSIGEDRLKRYYFGVKEV